MKIWLSTFPSWLHLWLDKKPWRKCLKIGVFLQTLRQAFEARLLSTNVNLYRKSWHKNNDVDLEMDTYVLWIFRHSVESMMIQFLQKNLIYDIFTHNLFFWVFHLCSLNWNQNKPLRKIRYLITEPAPMTFSQL